MTYSRLTLVGNLGADPELRYLPSGQAVTNMNIATNSTYVNQAGEKVKETTWFRCSVFGKQAESASQYLKKGRQVLIEGRLKPDPNTGGPRVFQAKDGSNRASYEVVASVVRFLGTANGEREPESEDAQPF